jgi:drug/metabolite transporter (DMT)-like permease
MNWTTFTLLNIIANGSAIFIYKATNTKFKMGFIEVMFEAILFAFFTYLLFFFLYFHSAEFFFDIRIIFYLIMSIFLNTFALYFYIRSISTGELSLLAIIENLRPLFVVIFSFFFLKEQISYNLMLGTLLIISATVILFIQKKLSNIIRSIKESKAVIFMIFSTALYGLDGIVDQCALKIIDPSKYILFLLGGMSLTYAMILIKSRNFSQLKIFTPSIAMMGVLLALGFIGIINALKLANAVFVIPLQMTRSLYLSLLGFIFLKEKDYFRKIVAAILMLAGVFLIVR